MQRKKIGLIRTNASPSPAFLEVESAGDDADVPPFERFYRAHWFELVRLIELRVGDRGLAEELTQDAFAKAYNDWPKVSSGSNAKGWLYRVALNSARSIWRRGLVHAKAVGQLKNVAPGLEAVPNDDIQLVRDAMAELNGRQREVILLRHFLEMSVEETADCLGISPGSVMTHASRARAKLRTILGESLEFE